MNEQALPQTPENDKPNTLKELVKLIIISALIVIPFRLYIAQPFIVDGASMDPTFSNGEYLIVDEISYRFKEPDRGSVLIFKYPRNTKKFFIKRVIGLPGETIVIEGGQVSIKNSEFPDGFVWEENYIELEKSENFLFTLGKEEYFVMGDNRAGSADSRAWGAVPKDNIIGRPIIRVFPPSLWPGDVSKFKSLES